MQRRGCGNRIMVGQRDLRGRFIAQFRFWYAADVPGIENEFACPTPVSYTHLTLPTTPYV